jgi:hypothetical protein
MANNNDSQNYSDYSNFSEADQFYREQIQNQRINEVLNDPLNGTPPPLMSTPIRAQEELRENENHLTPSTSYYSQEGSYQHNAWHNQEDFHRNLFNNSDSQATLILNSYDSHNSCNYSYQEESSSNHQHSTHYTDSFPVNHFSSSYNQSSHTPYHDTPTCDLYSNITPFTTSERFSNSFNFHFSDSDNDLGQNRNSLLSRSSTYNFEPDLQPANIRTNDSIYDHDSIPCTQPSLVRYGEYLASLNDTNFQEKRDEY